MCTGGELLADFQAGTHDRPTVPDEVGECLTTTVDGRWVVWAHKAARLGAGESFLPLTGGEPYPVDAVAQCLHRRAHAVPSRMCTCGFHALSRPWMNLARRWVVRLEVALSGRILAFEWPEGGVLLRAARQTVMRIETDTHAAAGIALPVLRPRKPDDPDGRLAVLSGGDPVGEGPVRLRVPPALPQGVAVSDLVRSEVLALV